MTFHKEEDFHKYLIENPESNYMWGDHQQLQITANRYNVSINVLTIDMGGNGSILSEPITLDSRLSENALLLEDKTERREMWLLYSNGNHSMMLLSLEIILC